MRGCWLLDDEDDDDIRRSLLSSVIRAENDADTGIVVDDPVESVVVEAGVAAGLDLLAHENPPPPGPRVKSPFRFLFVIDLTWLIDLTILPFWTLLRVLKHHIERFPLRHRCRLR